MKTAVKERPILFSGAMVRAILEGRKTQTRRVVKPQPIGGKMFWEPDWHSGACFVSSPMDDVRQTWRSPYGVPGDRLWVKETFWMHDDPSAFGPNDGNVTDAQGRNRVVGYAASMDGDSVRCAVEYGARRRSSIHMPRWASRITLEVVDVRVERVEQITDADAVSEGFESRAAFLHTFYTLNERAPVGSNPWVWVIEFARVEAKP